MFFVTVLILWRYIMIGKGGGRGREGNGESEREAEKEMVRVNALKKYLVYYKEVRYSILINLNN